MDGKVINTNNLKSKPSLQFRQGKQSPFFGLVRALLIDAGEGGPRKQMNGSHHCADKPFDVSAKVGAPRWAMIELNAILLTSAGENVGMKLLRIIDMDRARQSSCCPFKILKFPFCMPRSFSHNSVRECETLRNG